MLFIFFLTAMCQARIYSLFLQKIRRPVLFSYKLITFSSNWWINLPREICGYCVRRFRKLPWQHLHWSSQWSCSPPTWELLILPDFQNTGGFYRWVIYKSSCSALINAVKYLNFHNSGSKLESITCKFTKNCTSTQ